VLRKKAAAKEARRHAAGEKGRVACRSKRYHFGTDTEIDTCCAKVTAIIIYGKCRLFGLLGREEDIVICWDEIQCIGEDTVLVKYCPPPGAASHRRGDSILDRLFG